MRLLQALVLRPLRRDRLRTALTVLSVALGVAVVVAIDLAGEAATGSFDSSLRTLLGSTDLEIVGNGAIDETWMGKLAGLPLHARFAPVLETHVEIPGAGFVPLYGVDLVPQSLTRPSAAGTPGLLLSKPLFSRLHGPGRLTLLLNDRLQTLPVAGAIPASAEAEFLVLDVAEAQSALNAYGKLDRIDVYLSSREDPARAEQAIRAVLPPGYWIQKPGARSEENQRMLRAFRWNLRVLSYISLVVGAFLIYNTIAVSVVRRRAEIGILRALGATRYAIFWLFLTEALLLGLIGSLAGVLLGRLLAESIVSLIAGTVNSLYTSSRPAPISLDLAGVWTGVVAGAAVAVLSAFAPSREAMQVPPAEAMSRGAHEHQARLRWRRGLGWSAALSLVALAASQIHPIGGNPLGGYAAAFIAIASAALAAPAVVLLVHRLTRASTRRVFGPEGLLAGRSLAASLARTSVVVGALATAIAMMASVGIMVGSFRQTVLVWLDSQLRADLFVRAAARAGAGQYPPLSSEVESLVAAIPGVAAVDVFHGLEFRYRGERATLGAGILEIVRRFGRLRFLPGEDRDAILRSLPGRDRAIVSEPFANRHGVHVGDRLPLALGSRIVPVEVAGIYYEYSSTQGFVVLDRSTLLRYLPHQPPTNLAIYLEPGADLRLVQREIQRRTAAWRVLVAPNQTLRENAIAVFDRTFAITWALEGVAIIVAMLGAANSLLALVLDRRRELALLRYLGATTTQVRRMVLLEAAFVGLLGNILGLALGLVLSLLLIFVVNKQSFGWTIQFHPPVGLLSGALLLVWGATIFAGLYPARIAARLDPSEVIHEE